MPRKEGLDTYNLNTLETSIRGLGFQFFYTPETATTMILVDNHFQQRAESPMVYLADHQTRGQGRGEGRVWTDTAMSSILVSVGLQAKEATTPILSDLIALVTCRALRRNGVSDAKVKYPNDLVVDGKKTGGMLVRNVYDGTEYLGVNVGVGINVHYTEGEVRDYGTDYPATALAVYNPNIRREALLLNILSSIRDLSTEAHLVAVNPYYRERYDALWTEYSLVLGREIQVESGEDIMVKGQVMETQIGRGILVKDVLGSRWFNEFDMTTKVRLVN